MREERKNKLKSIMDKMDRLFHSKEKDEDEEENEIEEKIEKVLDDIVKTIEETILKND